MTNTNNINIVSDIAAVTESKKQIAEFFEQDLWGWWNTEEMKSVLFQSIDSNYKIQLWIPKEDFDTYKIGEIHRIYNLRQPGYFKGCYKLMGTFRTVDTCVDGFKSGYRQWIIK